LQLTAYSDILKAIQETVQIGVVPQENTIYGNVIETSDCLRHLKCGFVKGEVTLQIQHCLLALKGVELEDVDTVLSHEQVCLLSVVLDNVCVSADTLQGPGAVSGVLMCKSTECNFRPNPINCICCPETVR